MPSDLGPPRKRARVEGDADADATGVQKDEQVWFSDGSIVVVAANKVAFRVHKGTLSLRSEVFRDLFSLAVTHADSDAATEETMDGCSVVHLTDSPEDIRHLFLVLCCGKNYYYSSDAPIPVPFAILASLVRMAHKYAVLDVLDDALSRLKKYYTNDLAAWQDSDSRERYVTALDQDAPTAIHLARLTNTPSLLPTAFIVCTQLAAAWLDQRPDGSYVSRLAALSVPDQARVTVGKAHLVEARATRALHLLGAAPSAHCTTRETCQAAKEAPVVALRGKPYLFKSMSDRRALTPMADTFWPRRSHWRKFCGSLPVLFSLQIDGESWPRRSVAEAGP